MLRFHPSWFIWGIAFMLGMWMVGSQAQEYRYQYVSLNAAVPKPYLPYFEPSKVTNNGRVYGTVYGSNFQSRVAFYKNGIVTILQATRLPTTSNLL